MALINITPVMTSNTTPAPYVASASGQIDTNYLPWGAFTKESEKEWVVNKTSGWIKLDYGVSTKISAYGIRARALSKTATAPEQAPKSFSLYGSNDDSTYELLSSLSNEVLWTPFEERNYNIGFNVSYRYYKLVIASNNGHSSNVGISELNFYQDDGVTPTEDSKTVSRRYTLPFGSKLRLDNLTSDLTYMLATESDGENEGTLRIVNHAGKFILPKAGQKMDLLFDGSAGTVGNYLLSENITKYSSIRIVADLYSATANKNSQSQDRTVSDILGKTGNDISFSSATSSSRYIAINFTNESSFNVHSIIKGDGNPCIEKIYGIY